MRYKTVSIKDVCVFVGGSQPPKSVFVSESKPGYIRLIQTRDYKTNNYLTFIPIETAKRFCDKDDIMIGRYGPPVFQIFRGLKGSYNVALMKAVPKPNILNDYLYYFLKQDAIFKYVDRLSLRTGGQTGVDLDSLYNFPVLLPDIPYQQLVVDVLKSLDSKIEVNTRINSKLELLAKTIYDYYFSQFDFPDANNKPYKKKGGKLTYNSLLKRDIPVNWEVQSLDYIADLVGGSTPSRENEQYFSAAGIPWITPKDLSINITKKFISKGEVGLTEFGRKAASLTILPKGTILMSSRAPVGYLAIASNEVTTNQGFKSFVPKSYFSSAYIYYTIKNLLPVIENNASGSTFKEVSGSVLKTINTPIPPKSVVDKFTSQVIDIFNKQEVLEQENKKLSEVRDWLLPMLMNGQISFKSINKIKNQISHSLVNSKSNETFNNQLDIPENKRVFAKQVLGGKIVTQFKDDPNFTHIKFQKLQYLAEHLIEADLNLNYYFQAAGPYDNKFMHSIAHKFERSKWFKEKDYKFIPLENQPQIEGYYQQYFEPKSTILNSLFSLLATATEAESEIIATLYAVWNNRIILNQTITDEILIQDFYNWSSRKNQYEINQLTESLKWIKTNNLIPKGFGKEIKTAKAKNK